MAEKKVRNFTCVVYPDSAPENWLEILKDMHIPSFISPLHDKDINECTNEIKKAHYHVIIMFDGPTTINKAHEIFDAIGGVYPQIETNVSTCVVRSLRGAARYLQHLDNPDKAFYGDTDVICLSGSDYSSVIGSESDVFILISEMQEFCDRYNVNSFYLLCKYAFRSRTDWARVLTSKCSIYMREYLTSRKWSVENGIVNIVDESTGDIIL